MASAKTAVGEHRLNRQAVPTIRNWQEPPPQLLKQMTRNVTLDMGWGRLIFAHTFESTQKLVETLCDEDRGRRDLAMYIRDPHVVLSMAPHRLFLDPSHTFRLWTERYRPSGRHLSGVIIRRIRSIEDARAVNRLYAERKMVTGDPAFMVEQHTCRERTYFVAVDTQTNAIVGTITCVDHTEAFDDPENGASFWCLAVAPQCVTPGVGEALVRHVIEHYQARGRTYVDCSVMHDNTQAIPLYEKLGFERVPAFCIKHKNPINEPLFVAPGPETKLNPYARIIIDEARRRGIAVKVIDEEAGYFRLTLGGRSIVCRESLTELTTAIAMSLCDDKRVTRRVLADAGVNVPDQCNADDRAAREAFLAEHGSVVVKPARGEQGKGIVVDVRTPEALAKAVSHARQFADDVVLEQYVQGQDLRVVVINDEVVAAAVRKPPVVTGDGKRTIRELIERYSRRRSRATGGESRVPIDSETRRCIDQAGHALDTILPTGEHLTVRKTANLHTGGTIHDVTAKLHAQLAEASIKAARALNIPVVGLDLITPDPAGVEYVMIEANERVGLANHEPQPTAQKFIDFLFPQTVASGL